MKISTAPTLPVGESSPKSERLPKTPTVRTYTINLPTSGKLYNGKSSVEVSFFNTLDIKRLYDIQKGTRTDSIEKLIGSKIHDFKVEDLLVADFWYILYWMRLNSFEKYPLQITWMCERDVIASNGDTETCGTRQESNVTSESLVTSELDPTYEEPLFVKLPNHGEIGVKLLRISDTMGIQTLIDSEFKGKATEGDKWLLERAASIDNGKPLFENYRLVKSMTPDDLVMLDAFESEFEFGVRNVVNFKCSGCKEVSRIPFQLRISHFFPSMQSSRFIRDSVRSGKVHGNQSSDKR